MKRIKKRFIVPLIIIVQILIIFIIEQLIYPYALKELYFRIEFIYLVLLILGLLIDFIYLAYKYLYTNHKIIMSFIDVILVAAILGFSGLSLFFYAFSTTSEYVIVKNNHHYIARVNAWLDTSVSYYDDVNVFLRGNEERGYAYYGSGCFDPFVTNEEPKSETFYDK